jgi:hypothetical protein
MVSHDNITWTAVATISALGMTDDTVIISYLPLRFVSMDGWHSMIQPRRCSDG